MKAVLFLLNFLLSKNAVVHFSKLFDLKISPTFLSLFTRKKTQATFDS